MINIHIERLILDGVSVVDFDPERFPAAIGVALDLLVSGNAAGGAGTDARPSALAAMHVAAAVQTQLSSHTAPEGGRT